MDESSMPQSAGGMLSAFSHAGSMGGGGGGMSIEEIAKLPSFEGTIPGMPGSPPGLEGVASSMTQQAPGGAGAGLHSVFSIFAASQSFAASLGISNVQVGMKLNTGGLTSLMSGNASIFGSKEGGKSH